ncbi:MAG: hypothetical protein ABJN36_11595 [Cyclobacteriaceae bacterium]
MKTRVQQKLSNYLVIPIFILIVLALLQVELYWYVLIVPGLTFYVLLTHKEIEISNDTIFFRKAFNPFVRTRYLKLDEVNKVIYVDRKNAGRQSAYKHSYFRFFTSDNKHATQRIVLSDKSATEVLRTLNRLNISTETTTKDLDEDKLL